MALQIRVIQVLAAEAAEVLSGHFHPSLVFALNPVNTISIVFSFHHSLGKGPSFDFLKSLLLFALLSVCLPSLLLLLLFQLPLPVILAKIFLLGGLGLLQTLLFLPLLDLQFCHATATCGSCQSQVFTVERVPKRFLLRDRDWCWRWRFVALLHGLGTGRDAPQGMIKLPH